MKTRFLILLTAAGATGLGLHAQEPAAMKPAEKAPAGRSADEKAISELLERFTRAFNAGDAAAAAGTYTETALVINEQGESIEGRDAIRDQYAGSFGSEPGSTIKIEVDSLRFLSPDTAIERGRATIEPAQGAGSPEITRFTAIYVKADGRWLQSVVRDEAVTELTAHDHLKDLEWLLGEWVNESQDAVVSTTCKWAPGGHFIDREFTMKTKGQPVLSGTQRIGWDPLKKQFKTWIFDSEGGHGEGYWTRDGERWVVKVEGVRQDGLPATATNIITPMGTDRMSWQSADRTLGGSAIPEVSEFVVVRKPPAAGK